MGLDCSHGAFSGAYSAFGRLRCAAAVAAGGSYPPHHDPPELRKHLGLNTLDPGRWYIPAGVTDESHPGLYLFFNHSDCDGMFTPAECDLVADDLSELLPLIDDTLPSDGHIERDGGFRAVLQRFIDGCRRASMAGEPLVFH